MNRILLTKNIQNICYKNLYLRHLSSQSIITSSMIDDKNPNKNADIPEYMKVFYEYFYVRPKCIKLLDRESVVNTILLGQAKKLEDQILNKISPNMRILQNACCYGNLIPSVANKIGPQGFFDVIDIIPAQILKVSKKLENNKNISNIRLRVGDGRYPLIDNEELYDLSYCFLLLHEVPESYKHDIVKNTLKSVKIGGKVVFVDYHKPNGILKPYLWLVFRIFEPFGFLLFKKEIKEFAPNDLVTNFKWEKTTQFFNMYQTVTATRIK